VSPFMTVAILTVLWLIVVVPMIVHRGDKAARTRAQFRTRRRVAFTLWFLPQRTRTVNSQPTWLQAPTPLVHTPPEGPFLPPRRRPWNPSTRPTYLRLGKQCCAVGAGRSPCLPSAA
jgi:hypothetical protein